MNQLFDVPLYLLEVNSLIDSDGEKRGLELVLGNDLTGPAVVQFWPSTEIWTSFANAAWNADNQIQAKIGKFKLGDALLGGRMKIEHTILMGKPIEYEEVDFKPPTFEAMAGRVGRIRLKAHFWDASRAQAFHDLTDREVTLTARWSATDTEKAQESGQMQMGLPSGASGEPEPDAQEQLDAVAGLSPEAAEIVAKIRQDEAEENAQIPVSDSRVAPPEIGTEGEVLGDGVMVKGRKPPQQRKSAREGKAAH